MSHPAPPAAAPAPRPEPRPDPRPIPDAVRRPDAAPGAPAHTRPVTLFALCAASLALGTAGMRLVLPSPPATEAGTVHGAATLVRAPVAGELVQWAGTAGAEVTPDAVVVRLTDGDRAAAVAAAERGLSDAKFALAAAEREAALELAWRRAELEGRLFAVRKEAAELLGAQYEVELTGEASRRPPVRVASSRLNAGALAGARSANAREVLSARLALCDARERDLTDLLGGLPGIVADAAGVPARRAAQTAAAAARVAAAARPAVRDLPAGAYGTLGTPRVAAGESVAAGTPLVVVRDLDRPWVRVDVPTARLAEFPAGGEVRLTFGPDDPRDDYAGRIESVAPEAAGGRATLRVVPAGPLWPTLPEGAACRVGPAE